MFRVEGSFVALMCMFFVLSANLMIYSSESVSTTTNSSREIQISNEWIKIWPQSANQNSYLLGLSEGPDESVYVVLEHYEWFEENESSIHTTNMTRFDRTGSVLWEKEIFSSLSGYNSNSDISTVASNATGALYLVGSIKDDSADTDAVVLRLEPNGSLSWECCWGGDDADYFEAVTLDAADNIIAVGSTENAVFFTKGVVVKLSPDGEQLWNYTWNETDLTYQTRFHAVVGGETGEIYAVGSNVTQHSEVLVAKFNQSGKMVWNTTCRPKYGGIWSRDTYIINSAKRDSGGILVLGSLFSQAGGLELFSVVFHDNGSQEGAQVWDTEYISETDRSIELAFTDLVNFEKDEFIVMGSETERNFSVGGLETQGFLSLFVLDQNGQEIAHETWSRTQDLWGERIIRIAPHSYYIGGKIGNYYRGTDELFLARFRIEWIEQSKNQDIIIRLIIGSLIVTAIIGIAIGTIWLIGQKYQRK